MKLDWYLSSCTKSNCKWVKDLNMKPGTQTVRGKHRLCPTWSRYRKWHPRERRTLIEDMWVCFSRIILIYYLMQESTATVVSPLLSRWSWAVEESWLNRRLQISQRPMRFRSWLWVLTPTSLSDGLSLGNGINSLLLLYFWLSISGFLGSPHGSFSLSQVLFLIQNLTQADVVI